MGGLPSSYTGARSRVVHRHLRPQVTRRKATKRFSKCNDKTMMPHDIVFPDLQRARVGFQHARKDGIATRRKWCLWKIDMRSDSSNSSKCRVTCPCCSCWDRTSRLSSARRPSSASWFTRVCCKITKWSRVRLVQRKFDKSPITQTAGRCVK